MSIASQIASSWVEPLLAGTGFVRAGASRFRAMTDTSIGTIRVVPSKNRTRFAVRAGVVYRRWQATIGSRLRDGVDDADWSGFIHDPNIYGGLSERWWEVEDYLDQPNAVGAHVTARVRDDLLPDLLSHMDPAVDRDELLRIFKDSGGSCPQGEALARLVFWLGCDGSPDTRAVRSRAMKDDEAAAFVRRIET